ncbi:hypothetical protein FRB99_007968 [Tulasnella sp. 403]|nr:hypothetical protein FRB99_007968 [Tulasnella sp. 403]
MEDYTQANTFLPASYYDPSLLSRRSGDDPRHYHPCPGAAHRHKRKAPKIYVDPQTRVGKCDDPNCTWGYIDGDYIITDLKGYAYSAQGDPVMYLLTDGRTWKHVRLSSYSGAR